MFEALTSSLDAALRRLRGLAVLTERNVDEALRGVRMALLEADVQYEVARDFIERVKRRCLGEEVPPGVMPGQLIVRRIHEELVELLGKARRDVIWGGRPMNLMLLGLHGAGKTTTAAKLASRWRGERRKVLLVACDLRRPAAVDQLRILAGQVGVDMVAPEAGEAVEALAARAHKKAVRELYDVAIYDTAGRFEVDDELVAELRRLRDAVRPHNIVLVLDAAIGQASVRVARRFHEALGVTGLILTKLDGDARGGAALSVHAVTGCPILMVGVGEKADALEPFHPDRMASRILGMGDVAGLVERARQAAAEGEAADPVAVATGKRLTLEDLLAQIRQLKRMGPLQNLVELLPGVHRLPPGAMSALSGGQAAKDLKRMEAIILSMTPAERRNPDLIDGRRRRRIAAGSGTTVGDVNELLRRYKTMRQMMKSLRGRRMPPFG